MACLRHLITVLCTLTSPTNGAISSNYSQISKQIFRFINLTFSQRVRKNLSCPNVIGKPQIGYDFEAMDKLLDIVDKIIQKRKLCI